MGNVMLHGNDLRFELLGDVSRVIIRMAITYDDTGIYRVNVAKVVDHFVVRLPCRDGVQVADMWTDDCLRAYRRRHGRLQMTA